jgi:hypothetical protein
MCTSFVLHKDKTYIGMNFDISERPIKLALSGDNLLLISQIEHGRFLPAIGLNGNGTFMNLQMVDQNEKGNYRRGKNYVHIMRLFDEVLSGKMETTSLPSYLSEKEIVNVPNYSVHSLVAAPSRNSYIVEPGRLLINLGSIENDFMVLTNFSLSGKLKHSKEELNGPGKERYEKAYQEINDYQDQFSADRGLAVLHDTAQLEGEYPTQLSMIFVPEESALYFTLGREFNKIFQFSFLENTIKTFRGFKVNNNIIISKKGILLSDLKSW